MNDSRTHILVGVVTGGSAPAVAEAAAAFATQFGADLVCANVDDSSVAVGEQSDGTVTSTPDDPDLPFEKTQVFDPALQADIAAVLDPLSVNWSVRALAGGPGQELARLAEELDAAMIVVGTRESGVRDKVEEFIDGSVALHLAHRQHRPVVVIPLHPVIDDADLPWNRRA